MGEQLAIALDTLNAPGRSGPGATAAPALVPPPWWTVRVTSGGVVQSLPRFHDRLFSPVDAARGVRTSMDIDGLTGEPAVRGEHTRARAEPVGPPASGEFVAAAGLGIVSAGDEAVDSQQR